MKTVPMRVDFAGGWLDVPLLARSDGYIVNCAITPALGDYDYYYGGGLGGSAAAAIRDGQDAISAELQTAGWQDPAVILETGLCAWRSGPKPVLELKANPDFLQGYMAIMWTGKPHKTHDLLCLHRPYDKIMNAGRVALEGVRNRDLMYIVEAVRRSFAVQLLEGMDPLPAGGIAKKYLGSGHGGYALYLFSDSDQRRCFIEEKAAVAIEPYMRSL